RLKLLESDEEAIRNTLQKTDETERFLHEMPFTFYLLLDGLNEVRPQYREKALQEIRRISLMYPQHPVVVTSRVQDKSWRDLRVGSFDAETLVVQSITMEQAQHYLAAHLSVDDAEDLWRRLDARMQGLATTPLILWLIKEAWLETRGRIPGNRGELYANFIERMLRRDDDRRLNDSVGREARLEALDALALAMHEEEAVAFNHQQVKAIIPNETVLNALLFNGLLQGEDIIRFAPHQTVQEHFAARAIRSQTETELNKSKLGFLRRILSQLEPTIFDTASDPWWAETFIQLAGLTENPNLLARKIAETNPWLAWWCVREGQAVDPETEQVIQAQSALLIDSDDVQDRRNAVQALLKLPRARVIEQLAKLAIDSDSSVADPARRALDELGETGKLAVAQVFEERITRYEPSERAEIGRWLSEWGDMRRGVGINNGIPNIDWVHIPDDGMWTYQNEKRVGLGSYDISRYPVTCAQFQCFVDASDGFYSEEYDWFDGLHESARTFELRDQRFDYSNHPREPVNWYQAMAFCRWLSWKMTFDNFDRMKIETWSVRLPTEFEWEKAARGIDGRVYPYGNN
ncbi:MAG: SUMF1/EgtB/PvdO family nonheme iron enzyme, partial [Chloroflexota bacterium]